MCLHRQKEKHAAQETASCELVLCSVLWAWAFRNWRQLLLGLVPPRPRRIQARRFLWPVVTSLWRKNQSIAAGVNRSRGERTNWLESQSHARALHWLDSPA